MGLTAHRHLPPGTATVLAAIAIGAVVLAGCSSDGGGKASADSDGGQTPTAATDLSVSLDPDGEGGEQLRTVNVVCETTEGPPECIALARLSADDLAPVPEGTACTQVYGGPDVVTITGTLWGEQVDATFTRTDGCEIERFGRISGLLEQLFPGYTPGEGNGGF